jgi:riboflavin kinase/FMN adenylyltransferase
MIVLRNLSEIPKLNGPIVTLGTYDGVHLGHQTIIHQLVKKAQEKGKDSLLVTFDPHPRKALGLGEIFLLSTLNEKIELLNQTGLDYLLVLPFTRSFSEQTASEFVHDFLIKSLDISEIILGYDHRFGKNREGNVDLLKSLLGEYNKTVTEIPAQSLHEITISSTKIRTALGLGEIDIANQRLGYEYSIGGKIVLGKQLGRTLGYPTANIQLEDLSKLIPEHGVYAVTCILEGQRFNGMMNIGTKPTLQAGDKTTLEVHIFDFSSDIYQETVRIIFHHRIRAEQKFENLDALKNQLKQDEVTVRNYFSLV